MKPFDLDAAKRGEPIQARIDGEWNNAKFVGLGWENAVIVDHVSLGTLRYSENLADLLRMAPKKRTVWVNFWREPAIPGLRCTPFDSEDEAKKRIGHYPWTHVAIPVEIEE